MEEGDVSDRFEFHIHGGESPRVSRKPLHHGTIVIRYNSLQLLRQMKKEVSDLAEKVSRA